MPYDTVLYDPTLCWDALNHRYVCPVDGYYDVNGETQVNQYAQGTYMGVAIWHVTGGNASDVSEGNSSAYPANWGAMGSVVSDTIKCVAGDFLYIGTYWGGATAGSMRTGPQWNYMTVKLAGTA